MVNHRLVVRAPPIEILVLMAKLESRFSKIIEVRIVLEKSDVDGVSYVPCILSTFRYFEKVSICRPLFFCYVK